MPWLQPATPMAWLPDNSSELCVMNVVQELPKGWYQASELPPAAHPPHQPSSALLRWPPPQGLAQLH